MKTLKFVFSIIFSTSFLLTSCSDEDILVVNGSCNAITINIENASGTDILDFTIDDAIWDILQNGVNIVNICKDQMTMDGGIPLVYYKGIVDGEDKKSTAFLHFCGTEMYQVNEGTFNIKILESNNWDTEILPYEYVIE